MSFEIFVMNFMVNETINIQRTCMHICMDMENRICDINLGLGIYIRVSVKIKNIFLSCGDFTPSAFMYEESKTPIARL